MTSAPARTRASPTALPMPLAPPVMIAVAYTDINGNGVYRDGRLTGRVAGRRLEFSRARQA